jgi:2-polyprenyl-6-methoxyphenol hydroxylase-like FAD-dependent oxidoreductase
VVNDVRTQCCVVGCGPAGAMLGLLLARRGVDVWVLEKHRDFLRDYRGDNIHPSTLETLEEIGLIDRFLALGPDRSTTLEARTADDTILLADYRVLPTRYQFMATLPQWDFLAFLTREAARYPSFHLLMGAEVTGLIEEDAVVRGVGYTSPEGIGEIRATVTIAADGRRSTVRGLAGLEVVKTFPAIDMVMMQVPRTAGDPTDAALCVGDGHVIVCVSRKVYWVLAYSITKGSWEDVRAAGFDAFKDSVGAMAPLFADRVAAELHGWEDLSLLSIQADRLRRWYRPGLLAIGDAAHAMSSVGGVGINLAIQDAIETANVLVEPIQAGHVPERLLARVQRRRAWQIRVMQFIQERSTRGALLSTRRSTRPLDRLLRRVGRSFIAFPPFIYWSSRIFGLGFRRVHVEQPRAAAPVAQVAVGGGD